MKPGHEFLADPTSPRNTRITVYGRIAVVEALQDPELAIDQVLVADNAQGASFNDIVRLCRERGVKLRRVPARLVTRISRNGRHDQGVVADVVPLRLRALSLYLDHLPDTAQRLLLLDGVTNPSNVGMILRTATAAGVDGIILPHLGTADMGPLVIKASAGIAFRAPVLRSPTSTSALTALVEAGFVSYGLSSQRGSVSLYDLSPAHRSVFVLGNEREGLSPATAERIQHWATIPMQAGVESLNVAAAGAIVAFELMRRRLPKQ